jgi:hypothetical protein
MNLQHTLHGPVRACTRHSDVRTLGGGWEIQIPLLVGRVDSRVIELISCLSLDIIRALIPTVDEELSIEEVLE